MKFYFELGKIFKEIDLLFFWGGGGRLEDEVCCCYHCWFYPTVSYYLPPSASYITGSRALLLSLTCPLSLSLSTTFFDYSWVKGERKKKKSEPELTYSNQFVSFSAFASFLSALVQGRMVFFFFPFSIVHQEEEEDSSKFLISSIVTISFGLHDLCDSPTLAIPVWPWTKDKISFFLMTEGYFCALSTHHHRCKWRIFLFSSSSGG